jgi:aryl-alcohol dehydrogenase-like predicted oxidoreductase
MKTSVLGSSTIRVSEIGFGTSKLASLATGLTKRQARRLLDRADELGITFFDSADSYGQGSAEDLLGAFCKDKRDRVIISSKAGFRFTRAGGLLKFIKPIAAQVLSKVKAGRHLVSSIREGAPQLKLISQSFEPDYIGTAIQDSLRRLRTDYLDIFFLHNPPVDAVSNPVLSELLRQRKRAGQIRSFGVSTGDPEVLAAACSFEGFEIVQVPINRLTVPALGKRLSECAAHGMGIVANQVFGSGRLLADGTSRPPESFIGFAKAVPGVSSIIIGTTRSAHLEDNVVASCRTAMVSEVGDVSFDGARP